MIPQMTLGRTRQRSGFVAGWRLWQLCIVMVLVFLPTACTRWNDPQMGAAPDATLQDGAQDALPEAPPLPPKKPLDERVVALLNRGPELLIGIGPDQLTAYLGAPALIRHDAPAEVWMYQSQTCYLDLFLYSSEQWRDDLQDRKHRPEKASDYRVTYYEIRSPSGEPAPDGRSCISTLVAARDEA